jgi:hypothetical protein
VTAGDDARHLLGGPVEDRPRLAPAPVAALIGRVQRSATRATALAEALAAGGDEQDAAAMRGVAEALAGQATTLREILTWLTTSEPRQEADG